MRKKGDRILRKRLPSEIIKKYKRTSKNEMRNKIRQAYEKKLE